MQKTILAVEKKIKENGDKNIYHYFFEKQYSNGCDYHPSVTEHQEIAKLLTSFIKQTMKW